MGGQPGFLEMLPFLSTGPGMYLVFFPLDKELDEQYEVSYERDGEALHLTKPSTQSRKHSLRFYISAVSSIHTMCDPVTEKWLGETSKEFLTVKPIATLLATSRMKLSERSRKISSKKFFVASILKGKGSYATTGLAISDKIKEDIETELDKELFQ